MRGTTAIDQSNMTTLFVRWRDSSARYTNLELLVLGLRHEILVCLFLWFACLVNEELVNSRDIQMWSQASISNSYIIFMSSLFVFSPIFSQIFSVNFWLVEVQKHGAQLVFAKRQKTPGLA